MRPRRQRDHGGASRPSHLDGRGRVVMVDVGSKSPSLREAVAEGTIRMSPQAHRMMRGGRVAKGDAIALARVAGIAAAKRTSELIPLCHAVPLDHVEVQVRHGADGRTMKVEARARARWSTGVEMEALVAVSTALLTIYDMLKAVDRSMTMGPIRLTRKSGGRSGDFVRTIRGKRARS